MSADSKFAAVQPYVPLESHGPLAVVSFALAMVTTAAFFFNEGRTNRSTVLSLVIALISSAAWGPAIIFTFLWSGIFL